MPEERFPIDLLRSTDDTTIRRLVEGWLGPPTASAADVHIRDPTPDSLVGLHRVAGQWPDLFQQNHLVPLDEGWVDTGRRVIISENQNVWRWAIDEPDLRLPDPPVWLHDGDNEWRREPEPLSRVLLAAVLTELIITGHARSFANGGVGPDLLRAALRPLQRLPISPVGMHPTSYFAGPDMLAQVDGGSRPWAWLSGRTEEALDHLVPIVAADPGPWIAFSRWEG